MNEDQRHMLQKHDVDMYNSKDGVTVRLAKLETNVGLIMKIGMAILLGEALNFANSLYHIVVH